MQKHPQGKQAEFDVLLTDDKYTRTITSNNIWRNRCLLSKKSSSYIEQKVEQNYEDWTLMRDAVRQLLH